MNFEHERICSKAVGVTRTKFGCRNQTGATQWPLNVDFVEESPFTRRRLATGAASNEAKLGLCASGGEDRRRKGN